MVLHFFLNVSLFKVPVRLAGVKDIDYAGRVEVFYQGKWGKICRNEWDINDVKVVCKQLGFKSALAEFIGMDTKDEAVSIVMKNVGCIGKEPVLASCKRLDGEHKCVDNIGAQALCEPSKLKSANVKNVRYVILRCGAYITLQGLLEFNGFELKIKCSHQQNVSEAVTIQQIEEYSNSFRAQEHRA